MHRRNGFGRLSKQFSSFDRAGGNADFQHCLRPAPNGGCVLAESSGAGEIDSIWGTNFFNGTSGREDGAGNLHVVLDGHTILDAPLQQIVEGKLGAPFVFTVPVTGRYELSSVQTLAPDYGISNLAVDGTVVGTPFDGFHANGVAVSPLTDDGSVQRSAGRHVLTLTVTGKNAAAIGYSAGLDYLTLQLAG